MSIDFSSFQGVFQWVSAHGYFFIFLVMCLEGPVTTAAAGFGVALGIFNPFIILAISILGDLIPDTIYYVLGWLGRFRLIRRTGKVMNFTSPRMVHLEADLKKHFKKTMIVLKLTPVVTTFGFMLVGYLRLPFRRFILWCTIMTVPKSIIFLALGYFFGQAYNINTYLHRTAIVLPLIAVAVIAFSIAYNIVSARLLRKVERI